MTVGISSPKREETTPRARRDGRERLIDGARKLLAERGYAGMELRDVAERGRAPRGSIYHHFPGGKAELAVAATEEEGERVRLALRESMQKHGVRATLKRFGDLFRRRAAERPELIGCPVAAAALARPEDPALAAAATAAFVAWEREIALALEREGVDADRARGFAGLVVASIEGALLRARAAGDDAPLDIAVEGLEAALDQLLADPA